MSAAVNGSPAMQAREAAAAIVVALARACETPQVVAFNTVCPAASGESWRGWLGLTLVQRSYAPGAAFPLSLDRTTTYQSALAQFGAMNGGTACAAPVEYARRERLSLDSITIISDEQAWADQRHVTQAMAAYRREVNPDTRLAVLGMAGTGTTLVDPQDTLALGIAGFDASAIQVLQAFLRGELAP